MKKILALAFVFVMVSGVVELAAEPETEIRAGRLYVYDFERLSLSNQLNTLGFDMESGRSEAADYDSLNALLLDLGSGNLDCFFIPKNVAEYIVSRNKEFSFFALDKRTQCFYKMATLPEKQELRDKLDNAIVALKKDGTVDKLRKEYIDDIISGDDPTPVALPKYEGKPIRVVVTGDLPPLDYVAADGAPAGFNIALLSAISDYLKMPIEVIETTANARVIVLMQGQADVIFWTRLFDEESVPERLAVTSSYCSDYNAVVFKDFPIEQIKKAFNAIVDK